MIFVFKKKLYNNERFEYNKISRRENEIFI